MSSTVRVKDYLAGQTHTYIVNEKKFDKELSKASATWSRFKTSQKVCVVSFATAVGGSVIIGIDASQGNLNITGLVLCVVGVAMSAISCFVSCMRE